MKAAAPLNTSCDTYSTGGNCPVSAYAMQLSSMEPQQAASDAYYRTENEAGCECQNCSKSVLSVWVPINRRGIIREKSAVLRGG